MCPLIKVGSYKGSQIRALSYRVKKDEVYKVPCTTASTSSQEDMYDPEYETPIAEMSISNKDTLHDFEDLPLINDASKGAGLQIPAPAVQMPLDPIPSVIVEPPDSRADPVQFCRLCSSKKTIMRRIFSQNVLIYYVLLHSTVRFIWFIII